MEYYSAMKKNEIIPCAATQMDLEIIILSEVSQTERQIAYDITHMWSVKELYKWTYSQNRSKLTDKGNTFMVTKEKRTGRDKLGVWD